MDLFYVISLGLLKILFLFVVLLFLLKNQLLIRRDFNVLFDVCSRKFFEYFSLLILILFITVEIGFYDGIVVNSIMFCVFLTDYFDSGNIKVLKKKIITQLKVILLDYVKYLDGNYRTEHRVLKVKLSFFRKNNLQVFYSLAFLLVSIIIISYYFFYYDHFLFSQAWFDTLNSIKIKDHQRWFSDNMSTEGLFAFINFLTRITNASAEITIYIYAILQLILLSAMIYWFVNKITISRVIAPLSACLLFVLGFAFLPININYFFQTNSVNLAFLLVLPLMYFFMNIIQTGYSDKMIFIRFSIAFFAISLIDLYVFVLVFPLYFILGGFVFSSLNEWKKKMIIILSYLFSFIAGFVFYYTYSKLHGVDFLIFLKTNLLSFTTNVENSYQVVPLDKLVFYYELITVLGILVLLILRLFYPLKTWKQKIVFLLFSLLIYACTQFNNIWIDKELLNRLLLLLIPIQLGIIIGIIIKFVKYVIGDYSHSTAYRAVLVFTTITGLVLFWEKDYFRIEKTSEHVLNETILIANEKLMSQYHDRTYLVVNQDRLDMLSKYNHYFIYYSEFLSNDYLVKDENYAKYRLKTSYLKMHPDIVMPASVLLFVYHKENYNVGYSAKELLTRVNLLKKRGREVRIVFKSIFFDVYEIINEPNSSKISEMLL